MTKQASSATLRSVVGLFEVQSLRSATDEVLLRRFVHAKNEAAFRVIAERHGPMVLGVCRRALRSAHDAEDACQATFLVFSRRASSIRNTASLGSWFHGVAMRVAMNLRRELTRRQRREQTVRAVANENDAATMTWSEIKIGLDEELQRLPDRYRTALVLCYLEGRTRDEAAVQLGLTPSALHGQLERGRKLLAARLTKRGLTLSAAFLSVALCPDSMLTTVRAAAMFAERQSIATMVAPSVLALTNETLKGMTMKTMKWAIASLACSAMLAVGVGFTRAQPKYETADSRLPAKSTTPAKAPDANENLKNTLLAIDKLMWEAGAKGDWKERQKFLADDLVSISILGKCGKADAAAADQRLRTIDWTIRDAEVVRVSKDVAMLTYLYDCKIVDADGKLLETRKDYRVVYTWANRNGGWLMVFCHDDHGRKANDLANAPWQMNVFDPQGNRLSLNALYGVEDFNNSLFRSTHRDLTNLNPRLLTVEKPIVPQNAPATAIDLDLLKTKIELAKLAVKEKQLRLDDAVQKKADRNQLELLKIELERARLLVREADLNLNAAIHGPAQETKP